jgi:ComF family protein
VELFKYNGITRIAEFLAQEMARNIPAFGPLDLIVPLPLNRVKKRERGFSQTVKLAGAIHRITGIPWTGRALKRVRNTRSQTGLGRRERKLNVRGAFRADSTVDLEGKAILLVDDVITTGASMSAAAKALRRAGATKVLGIAAATAEKA